MRRSRPAVLAALAALAALVAALPTPSPAQSTQPPAEGPYARARRLVSDGQGTAGRTLVDSLLAAATPGTPAYAEALYWRATLAERAADAERDYRLLAVEYGFSPRSVDAVVRLAQLDLVRGDARGARERLERLLRDHPDAAVQARGRYWLARAHLDLGDPRGACASLDAAARSAAPGSDVARLVSGLRPSVPNCETFLAGARPTPPRVAKEPATAPAATSAAAPSGRPQFTVQVAAYDDRPGAEAAAARLVRLGLPARVSAQGPNADRPPFRVRIGRFATRAEAAAELRRLRARRMAGFVTEAEPEAAAPARP